MFQHFVLDVGIVGAYGIGCVLGCLRNTELLQLSHPPERDTVFLST